MKKEDRNIYYKYFKIFYRQNAGDMIFFARKFVDFQTAEDIVHDVFLKIWDSKSTIIIDKSTRNYLITMVRNACLDYLKRKNTEESLADKVINQTLIDELSMYDDMQESGLHNNDYLEYVYTVIEKLPHKRRLVFEMAYIEEKKNADIARKLNISVRTVETHIYQALKFIRENLNSFFLLF